MRPDAPVVDSQPHLRAAVEKSKNSDPQLDQAIDALRGLAEDYRELERLLSAPLRRNYPPEVRLHPKIDPTELASSIAQQERRRLGLGDQPVLQLRNVLEWDVGLRIFYWKLPSAIAGMYACTEDLDGCILISRQHPEERRRMSLMHEYGHLIIDRYKPGIDYLSMSGRKPANERFAEAFAVKFLLPSSSVTQRFHDIVNSTGDFQVADLRRLSHFYLVSVEAMALRLEHLSLLPRGSWQFLKDSKFAAREAARLLDLPSHPIDDNPFPERFKDLAVQAFEKELISQGRLAKILRCDPVTAREIVASCRATEWLTDEGLSRSHALEFSRSLLTEGA